jgi:Ca-activated chloride channel family protein
MNTELKLSTKFLTSQAAHQVGMLVTVGSEAPVERPPINVSLVLDRSGSMAGQPLEAAKEAAVAFAGFLSAGDRLSVVAFDNQVFPMWGPRAAGDPTVEHVIRSIQPGGTTNLSGGWLKGREFVQGGIVQGTNRVVLLTDGCANCGITDDEQLAALTRGAQSESVSTTCVGFGAHFNEDLLKAMSDAGRGNYWYVEHHDQMGGIFDEEIEGLVALAGQNLEVVVRLTDPRVQGVTFLQDYPTRRLDDGSWHVVLGDLYATSARSLGLIFHVENVTDLGQVQLGEVHVSADHLVPEGIEHRDTTMPVVANLDGADHVEPEVETTLVRFEAARARKEAVDSADRGEFEDAASKLRQASARLAELPRTPYLTDEMEDLENEARRMEASQYDASDRKYHMARMVAERDQNLAYADKISRLKRSKGSGTKRRKP